MSTFADLSSRAAGVGVAYLLEGSVDIFATVAYAYSTHEGLFGAASAYDARIIEIGDLQRGFGVDGTLAASSVNVRLANTDAGADFLITSPTILFKVRWRLKVVVFDEANPSDFATKVLGIFVNLDNPSRDGSSVSLTLADDCFGQGAELAITPTWDEALSGALISDSTQPPVPIAMGGGTIPVLLAHYQTTDTTVYGVLCATVDTAAVDASEVSQVEIRSPALTLPLGQQSLKVGATEHWTNSAGVLTSYPLYTVAKTASLTKDGRTWQVLYLNIYTQNLCDWLTIKQYLVPNTPDPVPLTIWFSYFMSTVLPGLTLLASGPRFSSRTYSPAGYVGTSGISIRAPDIVYDLLRYYSRGLGSGDVNQASFTAATAAYPMFFFTASYYFTNFIQGVTVVSNGSALGRQTNPGVASTAKGMLRSAINTLCQGGLFDVVTDWNGQFTAFILANNFNLQTSTPTPVDETLMSNITDKVPSAGERWAPYNRIIFQSNGRIVDNATAIASWGVVLSRTINDSAVAIMEDLSGADFGVGTFGGIGTLESALRPILSFDYPLDALNWELGDFIGITWSRGETGLGPWAATVFRIEALTLHPSRCTVSVKAVFINDLATQLPYLLDDETLLVRTKNNGTSLIALQDTNNSISVTALFLDNFITMGVAAGDLIVLRDSTQAADVFTRCRALLITSVPSAFNIIVTGDLTFGYPAGGTMLAADWSILRGATTYPTAVSDPTNYPSGGRMYGKESETGTFSDASTANVLQAG